MIDRAQEIIFAAGARQSGSEFRIRERAAQRTNAPGDPQREDRKPRGQTRYLKSEARENAGADHVGDDDAGRGEGRNSMFAFHDTGHSATHVEGECVSVNGVALSALTGRRRE